MKILSLYCRGAKTIMSATHPAPFSLSKVFIPLLKPNLILTLSSEDEKMFRSLSCKTEFLPVGVDTEKFIPVSKETKCSLRQKYGLGKDKFIILHVGSIKERRGLQIFREMQGDGNQVLIIGSTSTGIEQKIYRELEGKGCLVWIKYFKKIQEIYNLADCYVFPTRDRIASIALPLSVMEAMSCNLLVISTRFKALPRIFKEGNGFYFADKKEDFIQRLQEIKNGLEVKTRKKILSYSWENVVRRLEQIYEKLIGEKR